MRRVKEWNPEFIEEIAKQVYDRVIETVDANWDDFVWFGQVSINVESLVEHELESIIEDEGFQDEEDIADFTEKVYDKIDWEGLQREIEAFLAERVKEQEDYEKRYSMIHVIPPERFW